MMHRYAFTTLSLVLALTLSSCASHRYVMIEPPKTPLKQYTILEVKDFESNLGEAVANQVAADLPTMIVEGLNEYNGKNPNAKLFSEITRSSDATEKVLVLEGVLLSYEKGSRAKRYWLAGFGAGKAYCTVQCTFIDKKTGEEVLKANFEGELAGGWYGGSAKGATKGVVKAIVDYLEQSY